MTNKETERREKTPLQEGIHYYINKQGNWVFTEAYHLQRGYCCGNGCFHCPYNQIEVKPNYLKKND